MEDLKVEKPISRVIEDLKKVTIKGDSEEVSNILEALIDPLIKEKMLVKDD